MISFLDCYFLVLESSVAYLLSDNGHGGYAVLLDRIAALAEVGPISTVLFTYYQGSDAFGDANCLNCFGKRRKTKIHKRNSNDLIKILR
jgi:hypothetical protein